MPSTKISALPSKAVPSVNDTLPIVDDASKPALFKWFGADPGPAPKGKVPDEIDKNELQYIEQLLSAYSEKESQHFLDHKSLSSFPNHEKHLSIQRERYYEAEAFKRFYRDNTNVETINSFEDEIYHGVVDTVLKDFPCSLDRVNGVLSQAAQIQASGPLSKYARVPVKQGICHHFANEKRLKWKA